MGQSCFSIWEVGDQVLEPNFVTRAVFRAFRKSQNTWFQPRRFPLSVFVFLFPRVIRFSACLTNKVVAESSARRGGRPDEAHLEDRIVRGTQD